MAELKQFRLPDVGEGLTEADIVTWRVKPGDHVSVNQVIVEIETAKSLVELPCPFEGVVTGLLVPEGQTAPVGTPLIEVDVAPDGAGGGGAGGGGAVPGGEPAPTATDGPSQPPGGREAVLVGYGVKASPTTRRPRKGTGPAAPARNGSGAGQSATVSAAGAGHGAGAGQEAGAAPRPPATPPVRKLAKDLGVELTALAGSGPGGAITRADVTAAAGHPASPAAGRPLAGGRAQAGGEERIPVRGVRKHTAAAVTASAFTAPHVTEFLRADVTETMLALRRAAGLPEFTGVRLSPLLFAAKALLVAVSRHPMINSSWAEETQEIVVKHYVNLGIAATTGRGLLVPNIKDADTLSLPDLAHALAELTATAREGKTSPADQAGGTITITNVGVFGIDTGTPILTPGEAAILALGQIREEPWVVDGALAVRHVTTLALSFDHRVVDGDLGSAVLRDVGDMLTDPLRMIAWDRPSRPASQP